MLLSPNLHPPSHLPIPQFLVLFTTILWHIWFLHRTVAVFFLPGLQILGQHPGQSCKIQYSKSWYHCITHIPRCLALPMKNKEVTI